MKKLIIVFITIVFSTAVYAETSVWKLDGDNGSFYLAGSCHVLRKRNMKRLMMMLIRLSLKQILKRL